MPWTPDHDHELAVLCHRGHRTDAIAERMGRSPATIRRRRRHARVKALINELRNNDLPDVYFEGVASYPECTCPHGVANLEKRCWWMAGYHDAARGLA